MVKRIVLLRSKPGVTWERLRGWWADHTAMARKMEGLKGYVTNLVLAEVQGNSGLKGLAEFWFDTRQHHDWAYDPANPLRQELRKDHESMVDVPNVFLVEEHLIVPPRHTGQDGQGTVKRLALFKTKPGVTEDRFRAWYLPHHTSLARKMEGLQGYVTNLVQKELHGDSGLKGIAQFWFRTRQQHDQAFNPTVPLRQELIRDATPMVEVTSTFLVEEHVIIPPPRQGKP